MMKNDRIDVAIVGAGLAGLAAAVDLARRGLNVRVFERTSRLGGRARTDRENGYSINLGPHALYRNRPGERYLKDLGVDVPAHRVSSGGSYLLEEDRLRPLPAGFVSLLTTDALELGGKLELARFMGMLRRLDPKTLSGRSAEDWLGESIRDPKLRGIIQSLVRVATYADAPKLLSAELAAEQLEAAAFDGVSYVDGGWQSLVDNLADAAVAAGAILTENARVTQLVIEDGAVRGVCVDGDTFDARTVLITGSPKLAAVLSSAPSLERFADAALPLYAATLDVCLDRRITPKVKFATMIDHPVYFSVHSDTADVAAEGGSMLHAMMYLPVPERPEPRSVERELRALVDRLQPGWSRHVVSCRFLPRLTVTHALVTASGGYSARPSPAVPEVRGLFVAGDWVGDCGFLADASLDSARSAAGMIAGSIGAMTAA